MSDTDDLVKEFLAESTENLDRLDQDFVAMEKDPSSKDRLGSIFRTIHTIKGTCGFLGFGKLESVTHVGENLLSRLRDGIITIDTEITTGLLAMVDAVREMMRAIEGNGTDGTADYTALIGRLNQLLESKTASQKSVKTDHQEPVDAHDEADIHDSHDSETDLAVLTTAATLAVEQPANPPAAVVDKHPDKQPGPESQQQSITGIRVDVGLLDKLMNLVGELVLARNQVLQFSTSLEDPALTGPTQRLNLITTELQEGVMKTRMQPIGNVWGKFPRIVRDVAQACGKTVRVEMEGKETELDKTIIEAIKDPLTHIIRNSVDHGIETPQARIAAGKPPEGRLFLRAFHEGGQVNIEIVDDGAGLNLDRVKAKAIEKGLITPDQASRMSEREAINIIFLPGLSTAEKITNVSGRGVGMDVVKTNIEKIGGTVDVQTKRGEGTTLRIKIPLTLAIIPALIVSTGGQRFAIPQVSLLELLRLDGDESKIETIHGAPIYRLRGNLLPLVYLNRLMGLAPAASSKTGVPSTCTIVVLSAAEHQFGLVVDQVNDTEEIVVKPLGKQLKGISLFSGATIMGDGRVALILDVVGVASKGNVVSQATKEPAQQVVRSNVAAQDDRQTLLLMMLRNEQRMAIPLKLVSRLEEFKRSSVETTGKHQVVQYRGQIMPLINLADVVGERRSKVRTGGEGKKTVGKLTDSIQVVVFEHNHRNIGLRVERIMDVVEEQVRMQETGTRLGVRGTAVIKDKVTEVIDLPAIIESANLQAPLLAA
jgi:two-component system chemotaxis sensor kinase CheA